MWCGLQKGSVSSLIFDQPAKYGIMNVLPQQFFPLMPTLPFHFYLQNTPLAIMEKLTNSVENSPLLTTALDQELHSSVTKAIEPSKNRYGRPYISGRPLLTCDRKKIVELFEGGMKKIRIAQRLGITHSCVSKVLRRYKETGMVEARVCRTASCACPGSADQHDARYCRHLQKKTSESAVERQKEARIRLPFTIDNILQHRDGYYCSREENERSET